MLLGVLAGLALAFALTRFLAKMIFRVTDTSGAPTEVTFITIPGGQVVTTSALVATLPPNQSFNFVLSSNAPTTTTGTALLKYDSVNTRLGGFAIFTQSGSAGTFEALVPLSALTDYKFYMPFDNRSGFTTAMAIANPNSTSASVQMTFRLTTGETITSTTLQLQSGQQESFALKQIAPATDGVAGVLYVVGSGPLLSALAARGISQSRPESSGWLQKPGVSKP